METQWDGWVLNIKQQAHVRDELQLSMSQIQFCYLHTDEKQEEVKILMHIDYQSFIYKTEI